MKLSFAINTALFLASSVKGDESDHGYDGKVTSRRAMEMAPWGNLENEIGPETRLIDTDNGVYRGQCYPEFRDNTERTNWNLIGQPDGICLAHLNCAFKDCSPNGRDMKLAEIYQGWTDDTATVERFLDHDNPAFNLPSKVIFPQSAADVVAAVKFAAKNSIELSVKNSGHHYAGASTKANTLLVNMHEFQKYANDTVTESLCGEDEAITGDLGNQPCQLAKARGKPGYVRAGGGESWTDVYLAVQSTNEDLLQRGLTDSYTYHVVGGSAGSVSPMGWTFQGGLGGDTGSRLYGLGVDQVLMIEAVLPNGQHVRFGPTEWEDAPGFDVPKTTKVEGVCNANSSESDEALWEWQKCEEDINFDGLWFAFRGGGGGSFGIVTSIYLQLHPYRTFNFVFWNAPMFKEMCDIDVDTTALFREFYMFTLNFFHDPNSLHGVSEDVSNSCGASNMGSSFLRCYTEDNVPEIISNAWSHYIDESDSFQEDTKEAIKDCPRQFFRETPGFDHLFKDFAEYLIMIGIAGKTADKPPPEVCTFAPCSDYSSPQGNPANILIPKQWILDNKEAMVDILVRPSPSDPQGPPRIGVGSIYVAFGGRVSQSHDQASSLSVAHHEAGWMVFTDSSFAHEIFTKVYHITDTGAADDFPAFIGGNHYTPFIRGPLKDDWTQPCPLDFTPAERDTKCISLQETVWGTKNLRQLEKIKEEIDPNFMFDCQTCVSNNRQTANQDENNNNGKGNLLRQQRE